MHTGLSKPLPAMASLLPLALLLLFAGAASAQLSPGFYSKTCPGVFAAVKPVVQSAISKENRMGASLLRLFFHDCFVNGCDGSLLLDDTRNFTGEKNARPNRNSVRGFNVVDRIKSQVEKVCPGVVSCADILAIAARDSVVILGGSSWNVKLGRRDARTASQSAANNNIPPPTSSLGSLISRFQSKGLSARDMVALSGSHTIGQARCTSFRNRIHNETNIDASFSRTRQSKCPTSSGNGDNKLAPLDLQTPTSFDNSYFKNLLGQKGLLHSDQVLFNGGSTDSLVRTYSSSSGVFSSDFAAAMIKMGDISPLTGSRGEIRKNCRRHLAAMASLLHLAVLLLFLTGGNSAQLSPGFYSQSCPGVFAAVKSIVQAAISKETRMGASLVRLFFHDCFVNGCDGSLLLDDNENFTGEKNAGPNRNSARGFEVVDNIKSQVEKVCPGVVSCADIVAIAARDSVVLLGGPGWDVKLGRRDARTASQSPLNDIPSPTSSLHDLISKFQSKGLSAKDMVALSGSHTIGQARCTSFRNRIYNETNIDASFAKKRQSECPSSSGNRDNQLAPLDLQTPTAFDNSYFKNLLSQKGLLHSDQELFNGGSTDSLVSSAVNGTDTERI
ncbi:hypothetical protein Taro_024755 [Colocasia esculenta]|uniref:Peroxidase 1 n=1 Tax=Colocasia esculenta TaxID=4460 RepID=A0A843V184_COLES|nr:hypothetical protein [Colocasia esculenta]